MMMSRGFSEVQANQDILNETRSHIEQKFLVNGGTYNHTTNGVHQPYYGSNNSSNEKYENEMDNDAANMAQYVSELTVLNEYSFMLPNLNKIEDYKFRQYLQNDLIEMPTEYSLTE